MVKLQIKNGDENLFLYETSLDTTIDELLKHLVIIHNGRLKVQRICAGEDWNILSMSICVCDRLVPHHT